MKNVNSYSVKLMVLLFVIVMLLSIPGNGEVKKAGSAGFKFNGVIKGKVSDASVKFSYMKTIKIWNLSMSKSNMKPYESYNVNIFFSRKFTPGTGIFPIEFSYLNRKDTCGGSFRFFAKDGKRGFFSSDTKGKITIKEFSDTVKGTFEMKVFDKEKKEMNVSGSFELPKGDAFKKQ